MISIKGGTKTWSDSKQQTDIGNPVEGKILTQKERDKHFGGAELDEILNKAADPNWVDPSKMRKTGDKRNLDKDAFLKLFLTHLKNQDPTNPMESYEMAAQLAQFTSLEKLQNINEGIDNMNKAQDIQSKNNFDVLKLIGRAVGGDSGRIFRNDETESHEIEFNLKGEAPTGVASITNANNQVVRKIDINGLKSGKNSIEWNGMRDDGTPANAGEYRVSFDIKSSNGRKLAASTQFEGAITGVNFTAQGPVLMMGKKSMKLSEVKKIFSPSELKATKVSKAKVNNEVSENQPNKVGRTKDVEADASSLGDLGLSREMAEKLKKELNQDIGVN